MVDPKSWVYEFPGARGTTSASAATVPAVPEPESIFQAPHASSSTTNDPFIPIGPSPSVPSRSNEKAVAHPVKVPHPAPARAASTPFEASTESGGHFSSLLRSLDGSDPKERAEAARRRARRAPTAPRVQPKPLTDEGADFFVVKPVQVDGTLKVRIVEAVELAGGDVFSCDPCTPLCRLCFSVPPVSLPFQRHCCGMRRCVAQNRSQRLNFEPALGRR